MTNKTLGTLLLTTIGATFLLSILEIGADGGITLLLGIGIIVFGTWGGMRLVNLDK